VLFSCDMASASHSRWVCRVTVFVSLSSGSRCLINNSKNIFYFYLKPEWMTLIIWKGVKGEGIVKWIGKNSSGLRNRLNELKQ
jgi:hypothetical protein